MSPNLGFTAMASHLEVALSEIIWTGCRCEHKIVVDDTRWWLRKVKVVVGTIGVLLARLLWAPALVAVIWTEISYDDDNLLASEGCVHIAKQAAALVAIR